jgi:hypothetical protein
MNLLSHYCLASASASVGFEISGKAIFPWNYAHASGPSSVFRIPKSVSQLVILSVGLEGSFFGTPHCVLESLGSLS